MSKNARSILALGALALVLSQKAYSHDVGNGGGAWICKDNKDKIIKAELVDLFEARVEFELPLMGFEGESIDLILGKIRKKLEKVRGDIIPLFDESLKLTLQTSKPIGPEGELEIVDDSLYRVKASPRWCTSGKISYMQVANFTNYKPETTLIDPAIFSHLTTIHQAALWAHEAIYRSLRIKEEAKNSIKARRWVGLLFSDLDPSQYVEHFRLKEECGLSGSIQERILDCHKSIERAGTGRAFTWDLVSKTTAGTEMYRERESGIMSFYFALDGLKDFYRGDRGTLEDLQSVCKADTHPEVRELKGNLGGLDWKLPDETTAPMLVARGERSILMPSLARTRIQISSNGEMAEGFKVFNVDRNSPGSSQRYEFAGLIRERTGDVDIVEILIDRGNEWFSNYARYYLGGGYCVAVTQLSDVPR